MLWSSTGRSRGKRAPREHCVMGNGGTSSPAAARHSHLQPGDGLRAGAPGCAAIGDMRRAGWRALGADRGCLVGSTLPACSTPLGAAPGPAARPRALPKAHGAGAPGSAPCALPGTGRSRRGGARWAQGAGNGSSEPGRAEPGRAGPHRGRTGAVRRRECALRMRTAHPSAPVRALRMRREQPEGRARMRTARMTPRREGLLGEGTALALRVRGRAPAA